MDEKIKQIAEEVRWLGIHHDGKRYILHDTSKKQVYRALAYIKALLSQDIEDLRIQEEKEYREIHEISQRIFNEVCDEMMPNK